MKICWLGKRSCSGMSNQPYAWHEGVNHSQKEPNSLKIPEDPWTACLKGNWNPKVFFGHEKVKNPIPETDLIDHQGTNGRLFSPNIGSSTQKK